VGFSTLFGETLFYWEISHLVRLNLGIVPDPFLKGPYATFNNPLGMWGEKILSGEKTQKGLIYLHHSLEKKYLSPRGR